LSHLPSWSSGRVSSPLSEGLWFNNPLNFPWVLTHYIDQNSQIIKDDICLPFYLLFILWTPVFFISIFHQVFGLFITVVQNKLMKLVIENCVLLQLQCAITQNFVSIRSALKQKQKNIIGALLQCLCQSLLLLCTFGNFRKKEKNSPATTVTNQRSHHSDKSKANHTIT